MAGDRHSFWAGLSAKSLPPKSFDPVGVAFVVGSISAPGMVESMEHHPHKDDPLRALFLGQGPGDNRPQPTINMLVRHGVRSCLEYAKRVTCKARQLSNRDLSPHVSFVDMGGHGYGSARSSAPARDGFHLPAASHRSPGPAGWRTYSLSGSTRCKALAQARTSESRAEGDRRQSGVFDLGSG